MSQLVRFCAWVLVFGFIQANPISTPSSVVGQNDDELADLWLQLCGWKEGNARDDEVISTLRSSLGVVDGKLSSVSCNEPPPLVTSESTSYSTKVPPTPPPPQNQIIFITVPEPRGAVELYRKPPRVVVYVLPQEEKHIFNFVDMRDHKSAEPSVHFLSNFGNAIDEAKETQRVSRGVVEAAPPEESYLVSNDFEIIPATFMGYSYSTS